MVPIAQLLTELLAPLKGSKDFLISYCNSSAALKMNYQDDPLAQKLSRLDVPRFWIKSYIEYRDNLEAQGLPCIFEMNHFARLVSFKYSSIRFILDNIDNSYNSFYIPKKTGGHREISSPLPALLHLQRWILKNILVKLRISAHAHAYIKDRSIVTHVRPHVGNRVLFRTDLQDFFGSIDFERVASVFWSIGYSQDVSYDLAKLCTMNGTLPQGGATSPAISNAIFFRVDEGLRSLSSKFSLEYTRYADDICFSGRYIPEKFSNIVEHIITSEGFSVNHKKTRLETKSGRRIVCGISFGDGRMKPTRQFRRSTRAEIHEFLSTGDEVNLSTRGPFWYDQVLGKLYFWHSVEPDNDWVNESIELVRDKVEKYSGL